MPLGESLGRPDCRSSAHATSKGLLNAAHERQTSGRTLTLFDALATAPYEQQKNLLE